jgi:glutamate-1-semialdehyde aminotransferase
MLVHGADIQGSGGMLSSAHTTDDVEEAASIFDEALRDLAASGLLS